MEQTSQPVDLLRLREYIEATEASGASRLPPEPKLSEQIGVSRGRLRTLLKRLEEEGLIWRHIGKGTFVGPRPVNASEPNWARSISVADVIDARLVLEPQLCALAAIRATPADIARMENCLAEATSADSFVHWRRSDERLHRLIAEASQNVLLLMLHDKLRAQMKLDLDARIEVVFGNITTPKDTTEAEHRALVDAIRTHNPLAAEERMREHLLAVRRHLFGLR